jgi:hypothetical protein
MSWSIRVIGRRAGVIAALGRESARLTGNSKTEFDAARPHLEALVGLNFNGDGDPVVDLDANGSAYNSQSSTQVTLKVLGALSPEP